MTEYIKMRNSGQYRIEWFFDYYNKNNGKQIGIQEFNAVFNMADLGQVLAELDKKFELTSLLDKKGKFIKIIT